MCPGERYAGSPWAISRRPGERLMMNIPFADMRSKSVTIRCLTSAGSAPFQLVNAAIAPYSRGGALKFAATSLVDGTVISCHGRCDCVCASEPVANNGNKSEKRKTLRAAFIAVTPNGRIEFAPEYTDSPPQVAISRFGKDDGPFNRDRRCARPVNRAA